MVLGKLDHQLLRTLKFYSESSTRYKAITRELAIFVSSTTNITLSKVENPEFRDLLLTRDKRYQVPGIKISKEIDSVCASIPTNIQSLLSKARKINIYADICSKPGMTASFLGVTSHFIVENKCHSICLAVRSFPSPYMGERIAELLYRIVSEWNIDTTKVFRVLTDNGSNVALHVMYDYEEDKDEEEDESSLHCSQPLFWPFQTTKLP